MKEREAQRMEKNHTQEAEIKRLKESNAELLVALEAFNEYVQLVITRAKGAI